MVELTDPPPATKTLLSSPPRRIPLILDLNDRNWDSKHRLASSFFSESERSFSPDSRRSPFRKTWMPFTPEGMISGLSKLKVASLEEDDVGRGVALTEALNSSQLAEL
jgi:hypothetical protein